MTWSQTDQIRPTNGCTGVWRDTLRGSEPLVTSSPSGGSSRPQESTLLRHSLPQRSQRRIRRASSTSWGLARRESNASMITPDPRANHLLQKRLLPLLPHKRERAEDDLRSLPLKHLAGTSLTASVPGQTVPESTADSPLLKRRKRRKSRRPDLNLLVLKPGSPLMRIVSPGRNQAPALKGTPAFTTMRGRRRSRGMLAPGRITATRTSLDYL